MTRKQINLKINNSAFPTVFGGIKDVGGGRRGRPLAEGGLVDLAEPGGVDQLRRRELLQEALVHGQVLQDLFLKLKVHF